MSQRQIRGEIHRRVELRGEAERVGLLLDYPSVAELLADLARLPGGPPPATPTLDDPDESYESVLAWLDSLEES